MKEFISLFLGSVTLAATVRMATPILFTALGGCFSQKAGTFCIAFECFMLSAAFFAAYGSYLTGSPYVGTLFAIATGVLLAGFYGLFVYTFHANAVIVSIAFNFGAWAGTTLLLTKLFGVRGYFFSPKIKGFSAISIPLLSCVPYLRDIINRQSLLVYLAYLFIPLCFILLYKTPFGLRVRGVGTAANAARTVGVDVLHYKWMSLMIMGVLSGMGGAYITLSGMNIFSENMTAGRGFLAFAAILVGEANPIQVAPVCLLFAYTDALNLKLTESGFPVQILKMLPYAVVILVMLLYKWKEFDGIPRLQEEIEL